MTRMTVAATGDSFITRKLPQGDQTCAAIAGLIGRADVRFTNLEVTVHQMEGFPSAQSGGTWAVADPSVLDDLYKYGFNALAWANNHTLDYSYGGLEATTRWLERYDWVHAGVGRDLAEAGAIRYIEGKEGRIALIAATSTFHESWRAGEQRPDLGGRPGVNPLRHTALYRVSAERMEQLRAIAEATGINAYRELMVKEGFAVDDSITFQFGGSRFAASDTEGVTTRADKTDLDRLIRSIGEAKRQADYVLVSIHSHEMKDRSKSRPADFLQEAARACIDAGAHAVLGHGPHILRGVELYRGKPILYSLGNFIFQNETVDRLPSDYYAQYGLGHEHNTADALDTRSAGGSRGLGTDPGVWRSVIASLHFESGELTELEFHPISLGYGLPRYRRGWPSLTEEQDSLLELRELSQEFGTQLTLENGIACWRAT